MSQQPSALPPEAQAKLDQQREQFHRELMRKSMRITELEGEVERTRADYEESLSWRLTRPLRIRGFIRRQRAGAVATER